VTASALTLAVDAVGGQASPFLAHRTVASMGPRDLGVRLAFVGICGTDAEILHNSLPSTFAIHYPHSLGHEWSGMVEAVGSAVCSIAVGDRVLGHGHLGGNDWFGVTHDGAAAEVFTVPAAVCFPVPAGTSLLTAAVIEPFACVLEAITTIGGVSAANTVHIYGLGAIGLTVLLLCRNAGTSVVVFGPSALRRERARAVGAFDPSTGSVCDLTADATGRMCSSRPPDIPAPRPMPWRAPTTVAGWC